MYIIYIYIYLIKILPTIKQQRAVRSNGCIHPIVFMGSWGAESFPTTWYYSNPKKVEQVIVFDSRIHKGVYTYICIYIYVYIYVCTKFLYLFGVKIQIYRFVWKEGV